MSRLLGGNTYLLEVFYSLAFDRFFLMLYKILWRASALRRKEVNLKFLPTTTVVTSEIWKYLLPLNSSLLCPSPATREMHRRAPKPRTDVR